VRTTFITGMLTNTAQGLVEAIRASAVRSGEAREKFAEFAFYGGIWLSFACGGVLSAFLALQHGAIALVLPICGLAALIVYDVITPTTKSPAQQASGD
jgi:uncharacterized membrane protein YoaK (UPF0700 family)